MASRKILIHLQCLVQVLSCHHGSEFAYSPFEMSSTLAMDNDLVCQDFYWTIIIDEFFMVSESIGDIYLT